MKRSIIVGGIALLLTLQMGTAGSLESLQDRVQKFCSQVDSGVSLKKLTMDEAVQALKSEGYRVTKVNDRKAKIKTDGRVLLLLQSKDGDFQMYYGASGVKISYKDINTWNRKKRLSRAYLDSDGDPVLEFDLQADVGITPEQLLNFVKTFASVSVPSYKDYLLEHDQK